MRARSAITKADRRAGRQTGAANVDALRHAHKRENCMNTISSVITLEQWNNNNESFLLCSLFEMVVKYFDAFLTQVPLSFVLGFYVSYVANRWWQQFLAIPWPDK